MHDQLIEQLIALGFTPEHPDDEDALHLGLIAHPEGHGLFTVQVKTHDWFWSTERQEEYSVELDTPRVNLLLPHSCDEWVIADLDHYGPAAARSFAEGAALAADLFEKTIALIPVQTV